MATFELQEKIHSAVKDKLKIGMTELELAKIISGICPDWQGDLISGERTADIEGAPGSRIIKAGDVVLLDLQVFKDNQWSDLTRVYFMGGISDEQLDAWQRVKKALSAGEELLRPGTVAKDLWHIMREVIDSPYAFDHHGGHRIGRDETVVNPRFVPESDDKLRSGMVVTLEPAIYLPGKFGIRLENNYLITEDGFTRLDNLSLNADEYIIV